MERITIIKTEDDMFWVTSDENAIGMEISYDSAMNKADNYAAALRKFLEANQL